ncbi:MAG: PAS domain-containing protein [Pseudomonadota bacterium]
MNCQICEPATSAQSELVGLWYALRDGSDTSGVRRASMDPGRLRRFLSRVALLEVTQEDDFLVRLCGSSLRAELGADPAGKSLSALPARWSRILALGSQMTRTRNLPVSGIIRTADGEADLVFSRLPLLGRDGSVQFVLCFNEVVNVDPKRGSGGSVHDDIPVEEVAIAA